MRYQLERQFEDSGVEAVAVGIAKGLALETLILVEVVETGRRGAVSLKLPVVGPCRGWVISCLRPSVLTC